MKRIGNDDFEKIQERWRSFFKKLSRAFITEDTVCPKVTKYGAECPMDVDNECLSDQECSAGRKCCPSPFDDEACQLLCLEPEPQSKKLVEHLSQYTTRW